MPLTTQTFASPVPEAGRWVRGRTFPADRPLINVSQAAPVAPPPEGLQQAMAAALSDPATHLYSADLGWDPLRAGLAEHWSRAYGGTIGAEQIAITSGCNQAFAATIAAICDAEDEVLVPTPWYFNHKMWLDMAGIRAVPLPTGPDLLPDPEQARKLITPWTRAIVAVSPNNPAGVEYPPELLSALFDVAQEAGIRLILDETYKDFHSQPGAPHDLLSKPDHDRTLIQLYSFSKAYRMTGHRIGAIIGPGPLMPEIEKFIDTVTICPSGLGQRAALWGLQNLDQWVAGERAEILDRRAAIAEGFPRLAEKGWALKGLGAYFAYVEHPFDAPSDQVAKWLVDAAHVLCLPGTMFMPEGHPDGAQHLRLAFANIDRAGIGTLFDRLAALPLAPPAPLS